MLLASNVRLVLLIFVSFFGFFCRLEEGIILYGLQKNIGLYCINKFSTHKITLFSKSQPWVYSYNSLDILIKYILIAETK